MNASVTAPADMALHRWVWRWHGYAGLFVVPFIFWMSLTGLPYVWATELETLWHPEYMALTPQSSRVPYQAQLTAAQGRSGGLPLLRVKLDADPRHATQFVFGSATDPNSVYVDPYTGGVITTIREWTRLSFAAISLHGLTFAKPFGSWLLELCACWGLLLCASGIYLWWPRGAGSGKVWGVFLPRLRAGGRTRWRDLHAVTGFYFAAVLAVYLFTGLPWTAFWGGQLLGTIQGATGQGSPAAMTGDASLRSVPPAPGAARLPLDAFARFALDRHLPGPVFIELPDDEAGTVHVYNALNRHWSEEHFQLDAYSGQVVSRAGWNPPQPTHLHRAQPGSSRTRRRLSRMSGLTSSAAPEAANSVGTTRCFFDAQDHVVGLGWSPDGARLAALTGSGALFILDARDGQAIHTLPDAHAVGALALDWSTGGLATGGQDGKIRLWNPDAGTVLTTFDGASGNRRTWVEQVRWSPDGALLATTAGKTLRVWNPAVGSSQCLEYSDHPSTLAALCWRPDGKGIGVGFYGGAMLYRLGESEPYEEMLWKGSILSLAWSPNARYVAAGTQEATVNFWKLPYRPADQLNMSGYANKIKELAWDPTSRYLATGGSEEITVWDVSGKGPRGTVPKRLLGHSRKVTLLCWQRRGGLLVSGDADGNAALWIPERIPKPLRESWLGGAVSAATWSPDESAVAVGSASGGVVVWDVPTGK